MNPAPIEVNVKPAVRGVKPIPSCRKTASRKKRPLRVEKNRIVSGRRLRTTSGRRGERDEREPAACDSTTLINYEQCQE